MAAPRSWFIALVGFMAVVLLALAGFIRPVKEGIQATVLPVIRVTSDVGAALGRGLRLDPDANEAHEKLLELEARLRAQTIDYVRLRALEEENRSLRAAANFVSEFGVHTIGARVVSRSVTHQTAVVMIDRGSRDGVEIGQAVVTEDGLYVGKIIGIAERTSTVRLATDTGARATAKVASTDDVTGIVEGRGNSVAAFTLVPQNEPLQQDDVIVTAGTEEKVPPNLVIGIVNDVEEQPTDPFKTAIIEPLAPLDRLELVSVVSPGGQGP